jgi:hypothetical protein
VESRYNITTIFGRRTGAVAAPGSGAAARWREKAELCCALACSARNSNPKKKNEERVQRLDSKEAVSAHHDASGHRL